MDHEFGVERISRDDALVVQVRGDVDLSTAGRLGEQLTTAVQESSVVIVDLTEVTFLDSTGVRALVDAYRSAERVGRRLHVCGARNWVAKVLDVTGVGRLLALPDA